MTALERVPRADRELGQAIGVHPVVSPADDADAGVAPEDLSTGELIRELSQLHGTRHATFRHGSAGALDDHNARTAQLEAEYLARFPDREVERARTQLRRA